MRLGRTMGFYIRKDELRREKKKSLKYAGAHRTTWGTPKGAFLGATWPLSK